MVKKSFVLISIVLIIAVMFAGALFYNPKTESESAGEPREFSCVLHDGIFYAGIDFPAGNYEITALNGCANVYSSNMGIFGGVNELLDAEGIKGLSKVEDIELPAKTKLCVKSGIEIRISSKNVSKEPLLNRETFMRVLLKYSPEKSEFIVGKDFSATPSNRYYNIEVIKGSGKVESEMYMEWGINAYMSAEGGIASPKTYCNISLGNYSVVKLTPDEGVEEFEVLFTMSRVIEARA